MIQKTRYEDGRNYVCDDCKNAVGKFGSIKAAIAAGWAVSRDYRRCYCPDCAPRHRHTGKFGPRQRITQEG